MVLFFVIMIFFVKKQNNIKILIKTREWPKTPKEKRDCPVQNDMHGKTTLGAILQIDRPIALF